MADLTNKAPSSSSSFFGPGFVEHPFPLLAQMRAQGPIVPAPMPKVNGQQIWVVTQYAETVAILKDKHFVVDSRLIPDSPFVPLGGAARGRSLERLGLFARAMNSQDGEDHKRLRSLVSQAFTPKYSEGLRPQIQQIADRLLDHVQPQGKMDLVREYAYPFSVHVISEMMGVPIEMREVMLTWLEAIAKGITIGFTEERLAGFQAFTQYITALVEEKRHHPLNDLISKLIAIEEQGDRLNQEELISMIGLLIFAGHETTANMIGIGALMLLDHPEQLAKLKADLSLVPSAVEEILRFNGSVPSSAPRFATVDIEIGGQQIRRGDMLLMMLASANHDEAQFAYPEEMNITRTPNRHIEFGQGVHICLGAPLARIEGDIAFTRLLARLPNLRLDTPRETITWRGGLNVRGIESLPVAF